MAVSCKVNVYAKNGKKSRLFSDLLSHTKNREFAKQIWAIAQEPKLLANLNGLKYDENNEVTYESLSQAMHLTGLFDAHRQAMEEAYKLGIADLNGSPSFFESPSLALDRAIEFNDKNLDYIADVDRSEEGYFITISHKDITNSTSGNQLKFKKDLNNRLLSTLNTMGFDMMFMNDSKREGIFNPLLAEQNASNLKVVIGISKGEIGESAFPEEFAHLIIAGLHNESLIDRLKNFTNKDIVREVLGDQYEQYKREYSDATDVDAYLQEEAMGKMLAEAIIYGTNDSPLLTRIWGRAKQLFSRGDEKYIDDQITAAKEVLGAIVEVIEDPEKLNTIIDKNAILSHGKLSKLSGELKTMKDMALEGERLLAKQIQMYRREKNWDDELIERRKADMETMEALRLEIANKQYESACYMILEDVTNKLVRLSIEMEKIAKIPETINPSLSILNTLSSQINKIVDFNDAYEPLVNAMLGIENLAKSGEVILSEDAVNKIQEKAIEVNAACRILKEQSKTLRFEAIKNMVGLTMDEKTLLSLPSNPQEANSLEMLCRKATRDISTIGQMVSSLGDSSNILLNVLHSVVVNQQAKRNNIINEYYSYLQADEAELNKAGHTNEYIIEKDENGIPTGRFESPYDFKKYEEAEKKALEDIAATSQGDDMVASAMFRIWEEQNTEMVVVDEDTGRQERMPKLSLYPNKNFQKGWDKAQIDYYNDIISLKARLDSTLPGPVQHLYHAPQVDKTTIDLLDPTDPRGSLKNLWSKIKDHYVGNIDTVRSGENPDQLEDSQLTITEDGDDKKIEFTKSSFLNYSGDPIKTVPVYYTRDLEDMNLMSTDATRSMMAYTCMAVNYDQMSQIADLALLLKQYVKEDYVLIPEKGGNPIRERINDIMGKNYDSEQKIKGSETKIYKALSDFIEANLFGSAHEDMGMTKNGIKKHALFEDFRSYVSKNALGFNLFSGMSNVTMGEAQMLTEAAGGYHFNLKDLLWAHKEYNKLLPEYLADCGKNQKQSKLGLILRAFNVDEEFFRSVQEQVYNKNVFMKIIGKANSLFLQTAGEHFLHLTGALAILHHIKTNNGTLYDALERKNINGAYQLWIKDGTTINMNEKENNGKNWIKDISGKKDIYHVGEDDLVNMNQFINNMAVYINRVNAGLHGGYSQAEKGTMNRKAIWRLVTQFRQWMPGTYNELYHGEYYDSVYGMTRAGAYNAVAKFMKNLFLDIKRGEIALALNWNRLNDFEKSQCKKVLFQNTMFGILCACAVLTKGFSDKDRPWRTKMLRYQIERLKLETSALTPNRAMLKSFTQILQSPMAGIDGVNNVINALSFWNAADEIESGRYAGWSRWERDLFKAIPYHNIVKAMDMKDDNYMFRMFDSK